MKILTLILLMKLIISLILIYLSFINIYLYNKEKKKNLGFKKWSQYFFSLGMLLIFFILFVVFLRVLSFFRESNTFDLKIIFYDYNLKMIIVLLIFLFSLRKLLFLIFKLSFFKLHYFYLAPENNKFHKIYYDFYIKYFYNFCIKYYKYLFLIDKFVLILLIVTFFFDCILYQYILINTLFLLKYYSLFKVFYIIVRFVATKQQLMMDYYLFNLYYMDGVSLDEGFFAETLEKEYGYVIKYEENIIKT